MKMKRSEDVVRFSDIIRKYENMLIKTPRPHLEGFKINEEDLLENFIAVYFQSSLTIVSTIIISSFFSVVFKQKYRIPIKHFHIEARFLSLIGSNEHNVCLSRRCSS